MTFKLKEPGMRPQNPFICWRSIVVILGFLSLMGCITFPGTELPRYNYETIRLRHPMPSIDYDATFVALGARNEIIPYMLNTGIDEFQEEINNVFREADIFSEINAGTGECHLSLALQRRSPFISSFKDYYSHYHLSAMTLYVIPVFDRYEYILSVDVRKYDQLLKQYRYREHMTIWVEFPLLLIPAPFLTQTKAERKVIDNMLLNFLHDWQQDNQ